MKAWKGGWKVRGVWVRMTGFGEDIVHRLGCEEGLGVAGGGGGCSGGCGGVE